MPESIRRSILELRNHLKNIKSQRASIVRQKEILDEMDKYLEKEETAFEQSLAKLEEQSRAYVNKIRSREAKETGD